jgi:hypothetical protein
MRATMGPPNEKSVRHVFPSTFVVPKDCTIFGRLWTAKA